MHVQMKHLLVYLQGLIPTLAGLFIYYKVGIKSCRYARECFICTCIWLQGYMFVLTVANAGLWMMAIFNWLIVSFLLLSLLSKYLKHV